MGALQSLERRIRKSRFVQGALSRLYTGYILLAMRTTRWTRLGSERVEADIAAGRAHVLCCWHRYVALAPLFWDRRTQPMSVLASDHPDARLLAAGYERLGVGYIPLQTSGDNSTMLRASVRALRQGTTLGIAPDGPVGPAETVKPGALAIAAMAGAPVTPVAWAVRRAIRLPTWDRFILPLPFGRGVFWVGESRTLPRRPDAAELAAAADWLAAGLSAAATAAQAALDRPSDHDASR
jgi:lysophospholipid acyltransferase (LPLAT)-like uncharacterized protein